MMDSAMQLPGAPDNLFSDNGPSIGDKPSANVRETEEYLKKVLSSLHTKLISDVNAALAQVRQESERLVTSSSAPTKYERKHEPERKLEPVRKYEPEPRHSTATNGSIVAIGSLRSSAAGESSPRLKRSETFNTLQIDEDEDPVRALFRKIDTDGSGGLTKTEFLRAFKTDDVVKAFCKARPKLRPLLDHRTFKKAFETMDDDGSAIIDFEEFKEAIDKFIEGEEKLLETKDKEPQIDGPKKSAFTMEIKQAALDEEVYDVEKFYWTEGYSQRIARDEYFQNLTLAVIVLNAVYIGLDADLNTSDHLFESNWFFLLSEYFFCAYFSFEIAVRFGAFQHKCNCLRDGWFKFDSLLVLLMVAETIFMPPLLPSGSAAPPTSSLRLLRLSRLTRLVRLMRSVPELVTIVKGMKAALRAVTSSFGMVVFLIYVFAIVMLLLLGEDEQFSKFYGTLPRCMWTLLINGLFGNFDTLLDEMVTRSDPSVVIGVLVFFAFIVLATITVMNLLVGVLVNVVSIVADSEKEEGATNLMKEQILAELKSFDDGDGLITEDELNEVMTSPKSVEVLESIGVDISFLQTLQVMTYEDPDSTVPIHEILHQMLTCRRELPATMEHLIIQTHLSIWMMSNKILQHERRLEKNLDMRFEKLLGFIRPASPNGDGTKRPSLMVSEVWC